MNFTKVVRENGNAIMYIALFVVVLDAFSGVSGIGATAQTTISDGVSTIADILTWVTIVILVAIMKYFMKNLECMELLKHMETLLLLF